MDTGLALSIYINPFFKKWLLTIIYFQIFWGLDCFAQYVFDSDKIPKDTLIIIFTNNSEIAGVIDSTTKKYLYFKSKILGDMKISKSKVRSIKKWDGTSFEKLKIAKRDTVLKKFSAYSPFQYALVPSVFPFQQRRFHYQNSEVLLNSIHYGFSDYVSFTGSYLLPVLVFLNPRVSLPLFKKGYIGGGTTIILFDDFMYFWYGAFSYGSDNKNFTVNYFIHGGEKRYANKLDGYAFATKIQRKNKETYAIEFIILDYYDPDLKTEFMLFATVMKKYKIGNFKAGLFYDNRIPFPVPYLSYNKTF